MNLYCSWIYSYPVPNFLNLKRMETIRLHVFHCMYGDTTLTTMGGGIFPSFTYIRKGIAIVKNVDYSVFCGLLSPKIPGLAKWTVCARV